MFLKPVTHEASVISKLARVTKRRSIFKYCVMNCSMSPMPSADQKPPSKME